jgi:hypothetical protein
MDPFSYLSVLLSIVLGLGLSHLLAEAAQLVRYRVAVRSYTPAMLWMAMLFLLHVQVWWTVYELRRVKVWTFFSFMLVLLIPVLTYLLTYLLVPDFGREGQVDLRTRYYESRRWFFGLLMLLPLVSLAQEYTAWSKIELDADPVFRLVLAVLALVGLLSAHERTYRVLAPAVLIGFLVYIVWLFQKLA